MVVAGLTGAVGAGVVTWLACRWWYGRKLLAAARRLHKSDQGRLFSNQQTMQARQQIETLKKELAALAPAGSAPKQSRQRSNDLEEALREGDAETSRTGGYTPAPPSHGFAATQVVGRGGFASAHGFADTQIVGRAGIAPAHGFADTQVMPCGARHEKTRPKPGLRETSSARDQGLPPVGKGQAACGLSEVFAGAAGAAAGAGAGAAFFAGAFLAEAFFAAFFAGAFLAAFFAGAFLADFLADFLAAFLAGDRLAAFLADFFFAGAFLADFFAAFFAGDFLAAFFADFLAGDFFAAFLAGDFLPALIFFAGAFLAAFFAVAITFLLDQVDVEPADSEVGISRLFTVRGYPGWGAPIR